MSFRDGRLDLFERNESGGLSVGQCPSLPSGVSSLTILAAEWLLLRICGLISSQFKVTLLDTGGNYGRSRRGHVLPGGDKTYVHADGGCSARFS